MNNKNIINFTTEQLKEFKRKQLFVCNTCKIEKSFDCYYKSNKGTLGIFRTCKDCYNLRAKLKRHNDPNHIVAINIQKKKELESLNLRECSKCKIAKPYSEYNKCSATKSKLNSHCKSCSKIKSTKYKELFKERYTQEERSLYNKRISLYSKFKLTLEEYIRMDIEQNSLCKICKNKETILNKNTGEIRGLVVDHCHTTGEVRGLLCNACNTAIGYFYENQESMLSAIDYLKYYNEQYRQKIIQECIDIIIENNKEINNGPS